MKKTKKVGYKYPTSTHFRPGTVIAKMFTDLKDQKPKPRALFAKKYKKVVNVNARLAQLAARGRRSKAWDLIYDEDSVQLKIKDKTLLKAA